MLSWSFIFLLYRDTSRKNEQPSVSNWGSHIVCTDTLHENVLGGRVPSLSVKVIEGVISRLKKTRNFPQWKCKDVTLYTRLYYSFFTQLFILLFCTCKLHFLNSFLFILDYYVTLLLETHYIKWYCLLSCEVLYCSFLSTLLPFLNTIFVVINVYTKEVSLGWFYFLLICILLSRSKELLLVQIFE